MPRNIIIAITGGIAAYKTVELIRLLVKSGDHVKVVATPSGLNYVCRSTLEVVSKYIVYSDDTDIIDGQIIHTMLAKWADMIVIAPCSANTLAKLAMG